MKSNEGLQVPVRKEIRKIPFVVRGIQGQSVSVTGDFTGWSKEGIRLTKGRDGEWRTTLELAPGEHQYRLLVDGEWRDSEGAEKRVPNPFGSDNCVLEVPRGA